VIKNEKARIWVNRVFAFIVGGLLVFLIMNFSVAEKLRKELDESKYEATRLLNDAEAYFENGNYGRAKETLNTLFEKRPGSKEAAEGKRLYAEVELVVEKEQKFQKELNRKWEAAVAGIREEWSKSMAGQLRENFEKDREELEKNMDDILDAEWEKMKDKIREEWEKQE